MESLGKYQIIEKIGAGGFGDVYKGYDPFIKRHVAVKTCSSEDREIRHRFFQEAEIAGNLHHRNVTTVYDFGIQDGLPFLIQEYLSGEDLHRKIKRRDFIPFPEKLYYLIQVARGLAYAHSRGVIHRDIKPSNIRILDDGTAKIMDFGIARLAQRESTLTKTGMTIGTAAYLAPEQIRGEAISVQTDIFSYGVLAYELLTGERPFQGEQISAIMYSILNSDPQPIRSLWPAAPQNIIAVVNRCLLKQAGQRFVDGQELTDALEKVQEKGRTERLVGGDESTQPFAARETTPIPQSGSVPSGSAPSRSAPSGSAPSRSAPSGSAPSRSAPAPASGSNRSVAPASGRHMTQATHLVDMASAETALSGRPQLDEIEFAGATAYEAEPEIASATSALDPIYTIGGDKKSSGLRSVVLIAAFALIAGFGGWWFGARQSGTTAEIAAPIDVTSPTAAIDPEPRLDQATRPPADAETSQSGAKVESAANDSTAIDPSAIDPSAIDATGAEALETEPAPPPPPPPGRVTFLQPSWAPDMRVLFQGQNWPLPISREVDAGAYDATFVLDRPDYQQRRTVRVEIGAGQERNFSTTIPEPGQLDIRPGPRRPQGFVLIDNVEIGKTPIRDFLKEPGDYPIEIRPSDGSNGSALSSMIQIRPGQETIVTFDLMDGTITAKFKKSQEASTE